MSVYNGEKYLSEAIESILIQTYKNFEFIIINDGSTDNGLEIISQYQKQDNRIIIISRKNRGLVTSLNEGIKKSKGKYIARMDADDISSPERFEKQVAFMETNLDIGISGSAVISFGKDRKDTIWKCSAKDKTIKTELLFSSSFAHPVVIMRRELILINDLEYHDFLHAEDFELWTRMGEITKMANLSEPLLKYRIVENSISREANKNLEERYLVHKKIFNTYLKRLKITNREEENRLHFNISLNHRIKEHEVCFNKLDKYFNKIILANKNQKIFNDLELKKILGKKWLINMYYRKNIRNGFSRYFLYGLLSLIHKWIV
jgi:glycosyltransferase involved in cell wall biosynthesis